MTTSSLYTAHASVVGRLAQTLSAAASLIIIFLPAQASFAQNVPKPITDSGLNTKISDPITLPNNMTQYNITGGTRPGNGPNLFHSFGEFNVPANNIANFFNNSGLATSNILGRVTAGNPSNILGAITTEGFGSANLFLVNPTGIVFGPNASLSVGGSVHFTTADYIRFFDEQNGKSANFYAKPARDNLTINYVPSVLSASPLIDFGFITPAAFGFLTAPAPASTITVGMSTLSVSEGKTISLVSGGITATGSTISAPGGQVRLASVASPGEISHDTFQPAPNVKNVQFEEMGILALSNGTTLDASGNMAGTVSIRSGKLTITDATLAADTANLHGAPTAIDINVTGTMSVSSDVNPSITARTTGTGNAGDIRIKAGNLETTSTLPDTVALIDSHSSGLGNGGNVTIETGKLTVKGNPLAADFFIDSGTAAEGNGGHVTIAATKADFQFGRINTGDEIYFGLGQGGNLVVNADSLTLSKSSFATDSLSARAGNIMLAGKTRPAASDILISDNSFISSISLEGKNSIAVRADHLTIDKISLIENSTVLGDSIGISVAVKSLELRDGGRIASNTSGDGNAGSIQVVATDQVRLADDPSGPAPSGLFSNSFGDSDAGTLGNSGSILVTTPRMEISGGARVNASTQSSGRGGDVVITASKELSISGERNSEVASETFGLGNTRASGIYTRTVGSKFCNGVCGDSGHVVITTESLKIEQGGAIDSGTINNGSGGDISATASQQITVSGTMQDGTPSGIFSRTVGTAPGSGDGGNISLTAGESVSIANGATVSASSIGSGNAGNIIINAGMRFEARNSSVTTKSEHAGGGNVAINATDQFRLVNSQVNASAFLNGGNISIDPNLVILQNSQILAQAIQGNGGNITIFTPLYLKDSSSVVSASSQFGLNGTVTIQSPTSNLSGSLGPLTSKPSQAQSLLTQRCAALANGQASSFVVAGREQLPADPGGWLTSPLAFAALGENLDSGDAVASMSTGMAMTAHDTDRVSLRRLTPAGFLIANFADSEATGCHS